MTGSLRKLGLAFVFSSGVLSMSAFAQDVQELFNEGVQALKKGEDDAALTAFQKVLAAQPSHEQAYELWKTTEHQIWLDILVKKGDFELVGKRLMALAEMGRAERKNDGDAIKALLADVKVDDVVTRRTAIRTLAAEHGEFAVPYMLGVLGDQSDDDRRVMYMQALTEMGSDVVPPLVEALGATDAFLRRNVALTLGYLGDHRAGPSLAAMAAKDENETCRNAALQAAKKCGATDAVAGFVKLGSDYHYRQDNVLAAKGQGTTVWSWGGDALVGTAVHAAVVPDELAKRAYGRALAIDPANAVARMGLARAHASEAARLVALAEGGVELGDLKNAYDTGIVASRLAGVDALDAGLQEAVQHKDVVTAVALCRAMSAAVAGPTPGLEAALRSGDGGLRTEAALALAHGAVTGRGKASADVIAALGEAAGRQAVRVVAVVDSDANRGAAIAAALEAKGIVAHRWERGATALAVLHRLPGLDGLLVADSLSDLTTAQIVDEVGRTEALSKAPLFIITADAEKAAEVWGEKAKGTLANADGAAAVVEALAAVEGDRAKAVALAGEAASALADLAYTGTDVSASFAALREAVTVQPDEVALAVLNVIQASGCSMCAETAATLAADGSRSEDVRASAASAAAACYARGQAATDAAVAALKICLGADAPLSVRASAARALGAVKLTPADRAALLTGGEPQLQGLGYIDNGG
ncbi:MAG: HEAT repeat domain-containing protein [Planctomycetes bacterium]|nr:HEAT repeat domain-containing protein [Planctomycetota bacterium]